MRGAAYGFSAEVAMAVIQPPWAESVPLKTRFSDMMADVDAVL